MHYKNIEKQRTHTTSHFKRLKENEGNVICTNIGSGVHSPLKVPLTSPLVKNHPYLLQAPGPITIVLPFHYFSSLQFLVSVCCAAKFIIMFNLFRPWISSDHIEVPVDEAAPEPLPGPSNEKTPTKRNLSETSPKGKGAKLRKQIVMIVTRVKNFIRKVIAEGGVLQGRNVKRLVEEATGLSQSTIKIISKIEAPSVYQTPGKKRRKGSILFKKIYDFTCNVVRRTVYECYRSGVSPTVESITRSLREKTSATDYEFPYGKSTVRRLLRSMGFPHKIEENPLGQSPVTSLPGGIRISRK